MVCKVGMFYQYQPYRRKSPVYKNQLNENFKGGSQWNVIVYGLFEYKMFQFCTVSVTSCSVMSVFLIFAIPRFLEGVIQDEETEIHN